MPRWIIGVTIILLCLALVPFVLVTNARVTKFKKPRIHLIPDMDVQPRFEAQEANLLFADRRAMRPPVAGTVARGELREDDALYRGRQSGGQSRTRSDTQGGEWVVTLPISITREVMERGRDRYEIFCAPCHGLTGDGDGIVARRADQLREGAWIPPSSYHTDLVRERPVGHLFNTITHGIRSMPAYGPQIPTPDRWAIVAYIRALQRSQNARLDDVPPDERPGLE